MIQLNLLPDVKKEFLHAQRLRNLVVSVCIFITIAAGATVAILGGVMGGQAIQKNMLTNSIEENFQKIASKQENDNLNDYLTVQNQLSKIDELKASQSIYSRLFSLPDNNPGFLQQLNPRSPNNVSLNSVQIGGAGSEVGNLNAMTISGTTATFATLDNFRNVLSAAKIRYSEGPDSEVKPPESLFESVEVTESALSQDANSGGVSFTIVVVFNPMAFNVKTTNIQLEVPGDIDSNQAVFKEGEQ